MIKIDKPWVPMFISVDSLPTQRMVMFAAGSNHVSFARYGVEVIAKPDSPGYLLILNAKRMLDALRGIVKAKDDGEYLPGVPAWIEARDLLALFETKPPIVELRELLQEISMGGGTGGGALSEPMTYDHIAIRAQRALELVNELQATLDPDFAEVPGCE